MSDYKVKGSSINSKLDFVREEFGETGVERVKTEFESEGAFPVLDSAWYDFSLYDRVNRKIAEMFYGSNLKKLMVVGEHSAVKVLTTVYKAYVHGNDFEKFLARMSSLHNRFYNLGKMDITILEGGQSCEIVLSEAPEYSEADLFIAAGFYQGAAEVCGKNNIRTDFEMKGDKAHFVMKWE